MAILTNSYTTYSNIGIREDLSDIITNIAPTETPFMSACKKGTADNTLFEWQTDTLASAANNKQLEGDNITSFTAATPTVRLTNRCQISYKTASVSGTNDAVKKAGKKNEMAYQIALRSKELKRDMETALTQNSTLIAGNTTTARQTRGLIGWVITNASGGTSWVAADYTNNTAQTDGTQRAFTEALLKTQLQNIFTQGGDPGVLMVGPYNRSVVSTFTGGATRYDKSEDGKLYASISVYVGDFGELKVVPNRFQRDRDAFILDMDYWALNYLRPFKVQDLAKTGDAENKQVIVEYGLEAKQEKASGAVYDLTTS